MPAEVEAILRRRASELAKEGAAYIGYCHSGMTGSGMTITRLEKKDFGSKTGPRGFPVKGHTENTLSTQFLQSLNKQLAQLFRGHRAPDVIILADLRPLPPDDQAKVLHYVPALVRAEMTT